MQIFTQKLLTFVTLTILATTAQATNYQPLVEKFTTSKNWTWATVQSLPKSASDSNILRKDPNFRERYFIERTLAEGRVTAYGSQALPNTLVFYSGGWGVTNPASLIKLSDVINPNQLTKISSNCNFGKVTDSYTGKDNKGNRVNGTNYIDYQNVYKWNRAGSTPLYVVELRGGGIMNAKQGINSSIILTPTLSQLNTAITQHGWHKTSTGKLVSCRFS